MSNKKVFSNALWMIAEKSVNIIGLIFINAYMAKYVGPDNFGKIAFATSIFLLVQSFAWFGGQNVLFKRMSERDKTGFYLAQATQRLRAYLLIGSSILALGYLYLFSDRIAFVFGLANFIASYYIVSDVFAIYNNSKLQSHINTVTNVIGLVIAFAVRFIIVKLGMALEWFVIPIIIIPMFPYFMRKIIFHKRENNKLSKIKKIKHYNSYFYATGGALLLSSISIVLYTQVSNVLLAKYVSFKDLGIYSVAMTFGAAWVFVPQALITSYFSKIYAAKDKKEIYSLLNQINIIIIAIAGMCLIGFYIVGDYVISMLYGVDYLLAAKIIPLIIVGSMFSCLGTVAYRYMIKLNGYKYLSIKMLIIACLSIPLSLLLVGYYKIWGAVYSFLIIEAASATVANYFFRRGELLQLYMSFLKK